MLRRALLAGVAGATLLYACTLTRNLDYLTNGGNDAGSSGNESSTSSSGSSQTSTTSSSGGTTTSSSSGQLVGNVIAVNQFSPANLVQDGTNLYWTTDDNQILKLAKTAAAGATPTQLAKITGDAQQIIQAVADGSATGNVYLLLDSGTIQTVSKAGGPLTAFTTITAPMQGDAIAVDDTNLYLLASSDPNNGDQALILRYPLTPPIASTQIASAGTAPTTMVLTTDSIFWAVTDGSGNFVMEQLAKTAVAGTLPTPYNNTDQDQGTQIGIGPSAPYELEVSGQTAFWLDDTEGKVFSQSLSTPTGKATTILAEQTTDTFYALTTDGTTVYVTNSTQTDSSSVLRIKVGSTSPDALNVNPNPTEIILDDTSIYVAFDGPEASNGTTGGILKIAK